jgi:pyruvate dehydrogenase E1 component alpha subunit
MMAEIMGKETGYCRGKGGTMHVADGEHHNLGATGIVGGGLGLAVGVGLTIQLQQLDAVSLCFFGDGAANQGIFHESLNLASVWNLPVIFLCENNQFGEYTASKKVTAGERIAERARPFSIPTTLVDGMDVLEVYAAVLEASRRARSGEGPSMIEALTYRYKGHHVGDPGKYRQPEEVEQWIARDPIVTFKKLLVEMNELSDEQASTIHREVEQQVSAAVEFAKASPVPSPEQVYEDLYAGDGREQNERNHVRGGNPGSPA